MWWVFEEVSLSGCFTGVDCVLIRAVMCGLQQYAFTTVSLTQCVMHSHYHLYLHWKEHVYTATIWTGKFIAIMSSHCNLYVE